MTKKPKQYILESDGPNNEKHYLRIVTSWAVHCVLRKSEAVRMSYKQAREMKARAGKKWKIVAVEES